LTGRALLTYGRRFAAPGRAAESSWPCCGACAPPRQIVW